MFLKKSFAPNFIFKRSDWLVYFDEENVIKKSKLHIRKVGRKIKNHENFILFKRWIFWRWITKNFTFEEKFINNFFKLLKKLDITLTSEENRFIFNVQEIYFNTWRPIKDLPVRFSMDPKEQINFKESSVNVHELLIKEGKEKAVFNMTADLYFSFKNLYFCDKEQNVLKKVNLNKIDNIELKPFGVILEINSKRYLFRGSNKLLVYSILQRVMPKFVKPLNSFDNLYGYFDFWANIQQKIL